MARIACPRRSPAVAAMALMIAMLLCAAVRAGAVETVTVGWTPSTPMSPALIANDKGYFARLGLKLDLDAFRGAMDAMAALATGKLDVSLGGVTAGMLNAVARGLDARVVAPLSIQPPAPGSTPLVVRKDLWDGGAIRTAADLRGRKVAVNGAGNGVDYRLSLVLESAGMSLKDADVVKLSFPEMVTALETHGIEAAVVGEPFGTIAVKQGRGVIMMKESDIGKGDVNTFVLFSGQFIREHHASAVRFLEGLRAGMLDLEGDKWREPANVAIVAKYLRIEPAIFLASTFPKFDPSLAIDRYLDSIRRQEAMHRKNGFLQYATPLDPGAMLDVALAKEAREAP
jgi:NitT/TauT family transport system substrate-binding protein